MDEIAKWPSSEKAWDQLQFSLRLGERPRVVVTTTPKNVPIVKRLVDDGLLDRVTPMGDALRAALTDRFGQHPHIGDIRGRGLFLGLELVADRATKDPFDPAKKANTVFKKAAFEAGLICYPMGGTIDGRSGDHILLAPPYIMEDQHVDEIVEKLHNAVSQTLD